MKCCFWRNLAVFGIIAGIILAAAYKKEDDYSDEY